MKNIVLFIFSLFIGLSLTSCSSDDNDLYNGEPLVNFNAGTKKSVFVVAGSGPVDTKIKYGVVRPVSGIHQVKLVYDAANSTALPGVDFVIVTPTDELSNGETNGEFTIKALETNAVQSGKVAVFKLESATLKNAGFDQIYTVTIALTCPIANFTGAFANTEGWWYDAPGEVFDIELSSVPNQLLVKDFWDFGKDLVLNYNPVTFVISIPEQDTGTAYSPTANIFAKPSTLATEVSSFNPCTRKMTLYVNYFVPGLGTFGNKVEKFSGL